MSVNICSDIIILIKIILLNSKEDGAPRLTRQRRSAGNQLEIPVAESQGRKPARKARRSRDRSKDEERAAAWQYATGGGRRGGGKAFSPKRERRGVLSREEEREVRTRDDATGRTSPLDVGPQSRVRTRKSRWSRSSIDRDSSRVSLSLSLVNPLSRGGQPRKSVVPPMRLVLNPDQCAKYCLSTPPGEWLPRCCRSSHLLIHVPQLHCGPIGITRKEFSKKHNEEFFSRLSVDHRGAATGIAF